MKMAAKIFLIDESGATAIEYALLCSLIAAFLIGGLNALGGKINGVMDEVTTALK